MNLPSRRNYIPAVDKGIPPPEPRPPRKKAEKKGSRWPAFLNTLDDGDSFLVPCHMSSNVRMIARRLGYDSMQEISDEPLKLMDGILGVRKFRACRIWIYKK